MSRLKQSLSSVFTSASAKLTSGRSQDDSSAADDFSSPKGFKSISKSMSTRGAPFRSMSGGIGNVQISSVDASVSWRDVGLHTAVMFFTFIGICCFAAVAGFQAKWKIGVSGLTGFALFAALFTFFTSAIMFGIPFVYDKWDKGRAPALFLKVPRTVLILVSSGTLWSFVLAFATTISAFTQAGCKDAAKDPHADLGDGFQSGLAGWCRTKRAGSIFFWLAFLAWAILLGFSLFKLLKARRSRPRDEPFTVPGSATEADFSSSMSPSRPLASFGGEYARAGHEEDELESPFEDRYAAAGAGRASMDPYGAFSGDVPEGYSQPSAEAQQQPGAGMSRTMQMAAYGSATTPDPFSDVKQSLVSSPPPQLPPLGYTAATPPQPLAVAPPAASPSPHPYPGAYPAPAPAQPQYAYAQPQTYQPAPAPNQQPPFVDPYGQQPAYADPHQPPYPQQPSAAGLPQPPVYHQPPSGWQ